MDEEVAHVPSSGAVEVDARAPGRVVALREEGLCVDVEIIAFRSEVVVDHVEKDHEPSAMGGLDQALEVLRPSVGSCRGRREARRRSPSCADRGSPPPASARRR